MQTIKHLKRVSILGLTVCAGCSLQWMKKECRVVASESDEISLEKEGSSHLRLKHVQILFRHGARTPLHLTPGVDQAVYPVEHLIREVPHTIVDLKFVNFDGEELKPSRFDQHYQKTKLKLYSVLVSEEFIDSINDIFKMGGCTGGLLTAYGQDQMFLLGKRLKKDYMENVSFLEKFDPHLVKLKTTHMKRTKESLRCVLAGFFGAENLRKHGQITVESNHTNDEILVPCPNICPVFRQINHSAMIHGSDLPEFKEDRGLFEETIGKEHFKQRAVQFIDVRDDLVARKAHGLPFPSKITQKMFSMVDRNATRVMYYAQCGQHQAERILATRLSVGRLIDRFLHNIKNAAADKSEVKMHMYSAHDSTVLPALESLGLDTTEWPPFAADLILELYEDNEKNHFIRVRYIGKTQVVRGCETELCPLDKFLTAVSPYAIDQKEFEDVCHSNILEEIAKEMLEQEVGEIEDQESKERSDMPAGF